MYVLACMPVHAVVFCASSSHCDGGPVWKGRSNLMCLMQVDTTRGKKRIVSTVAIKGRKLYICNGTVKCSAPGVDCNPVGGPGTIEAVEAVSQSFDVL